MKKRMLSIILTVCMIMSAFAAMPVTASAAESGKCGDDLTWTFDYDKGALTISGTGNMWDNYYLQWNTLYEEILSVIIEYGVTSIGDKAFRDCSNLTNIIIPNSVTSIGNRAFLFCESLTNIDIPNSVTSIGDGAFSYCSNLTNINISDSVTSIGYYAFENCISLSYINVSSNNSTYSSINGNLYNKTGSELVQYAIGKKDTSFTVPDSVTSIGYDAFRGCRNLSYINVSDSNSMYKSIDGNLYNKAGSELVQYAIGKKDTSFTIPKNVTSIGSDAFLYCYSLSDIIIPDSVTYIGDGSFYNCNNLINIIIPNKVTSIYNETFWGCSSLKNITIPDSVTSIGSDAFSYCNSLTDINIPNSVTSIGDRAFEECSSLKNIIIPDSVTSIGDGAFQDCSSLTNIIISKNVTYIGDDTFSGCSSLKNITIPDSITSIDSWAFSGCISLTDVYYLSNKEKWDKIDIESGNEYLTSANIHYSSLTGKISTAEYDGAKVSGTVNFDYSDEQGTLYIAVFDNSGRLEKVVKCNVSKGTKSQDFEFSVTNASGHNLKAMFWDGNITPLGLSDETVIN